MPLPTPQKTWTYDLNNRIVFVSVIDTTRELLFQQKEFAKTNGYTIQGSSDGATGAKDGVDRWVTAANAGTRFNGAAGVQSWIIYQDAFGTEILVCFQGAADDNARLAYSPGGLYVAAGTPTHQPTATDEVVILAPATASFSDPAASGDRIWHGWVDSTDKLLKFATARQNVTVHCWGVEELSDETDPGSITWNGVYGFWFAGAGLTLATANVQFVSATNAQRARPIVGGTPFTCNCTGGLESYNNSASEFQNVQPELQGSLGFPMIPLKLGSITLNASGKLGAKYDWWMGRTGGAAPGDVYGANLFVTFGAGGLVWTWDGSVPVWI